VRWIATTVCGVCGAALLVAARVLDRRWLERHVLLPWYYPWAPAWVSDTRIAAAVCGLVLLAFAWPLGRGVARSSLAGWLRISLAVVLSLGASEVVLRLQEHGTAYWRSLKLEFRFGRQDPRFGWVLLPSRTTVLGPKERSIAYAIDAWGDRAASDVGAPDPELPSLVVSGESIAVGHGVPYEQTFAAHMGKDLGLQVVNVACGGYGSDQAFLRLDDALERLKQPVAAVTTFVPVMLSRNVQDYRARLVLRDGALALVAPARRFFAGLRLRDLFVNELPYMSEVDLRESMQLTAAVLRETARTARAHGAEPLFAIFSVGGERTLEDHAEASIVRALFVEQRLPFAIIDVHPAELIAGDGHPGAEAHRRIAQVLDGALRPRLWRAQ
jgi:nucleotide-binding universal stress UspA family protein